jgi:hypothetical protein
VTTLPARAAERRRRQQRWGGLGPYLIKVEPEEFVEVEEPERPARVPVPVNVPLFKWILLGPGCWELGLISFFFPRGFA